MANISCDRPPAPLLLNRSRIDADLDVGQQLAVGADQAARARHPAGVTGDARGVGRAALRRAAERLIGVALLRQCAAADLTILTVLRTVAAGFHDRAALQRAAAGLAR